MTSEQELCVWPNVGKRNVNDNHFDSGVTEQLSLCIYEKYTY